MQLSLAAARVKRMSCESALDACGQQCDQIGRIFALWATIQSREQQLFYPNRPHCYTIFVKVSKSIIFLVKSFLGNFYRHLAIFIWSHWWTVLLVIDVCGAIQQKLFPTIDGTINR